MDKNTTRFLAVLAILLVVFLLIAFVVPFSKTASFWLALGFGLLAIAAQLFIQSKAFVGPDARSKFYGFPIGRVGVLYLAVQLALSLLAMALASVLPPWVAAVVFLLLLAAAALGFLAADAVRDEVERQDAKLKSDVAVMRALQSQAASLAPQCDDPEARAALAEISEQFRYSDPVSSPATAEAETELGAVLEELQASLLDRDTAAVAPLTAKLQALLTERNRLCRLNK